jgi:hypothetical protein
LILTIPTSLSNIIVISIDWISIANAIGTSISQRNLTILWTA